MFFNIYLILFSFLLFFLLYRFKNSFYFFLDNNYIKPQSFHKKPVLRIGGLVIFLLFLPSLFFFDKTNFINSLIFIGTLFFIIGLFDDLKISFRPELRLILMVFLSIVLIYLLNIKILNTQFSFLNKLINNYKIISILLICLCLLFIVNGSNFIDGFNGLFIIHFLIILLILFFVNHKIISFELKEIIINLVLLSFSFLIFNFPKSRFFLGDSGVYFLGSLLSLIVIEISNINKSVPPFFFACLLFYLFFEVFFSFFRKIIQKKNPLKPDRKHLHMLIFMILENNFKLKKHSNYLTALVVNICYLIVIFPLIFFFENQIFCKLYFYLLITFYLLAYYILNKRFKNIH